MSPAKGRPPSNNPHDYQMRIRMTDNDKVKLEYCCKGYGLTKSEVIRRGLEELYNKAQQAKK